MSENANPKAARPLRRLFRYLSGYRRSFWGAVAASIINKIFDLMPPFLTAWIIDTALGEPPAWISARTGLEGLWPTVVFIVGLTLFVFLGESLFEWFYKRGFMRLAQRLQHDLRLDTYGALQRRELAYFEEQRTGNLLAMVNDDVNQLERFLNSVFNEIIQLLTLLVVAGWSLCSVSLLLGLLSMAPLPFIIAGSFYYQQRIAPHYRAVRESVGRLASRLENNLSGISVIKSFTAEAFELERVRQASGKYRDANFRAIRWSSVYVPVIRMFIALGFGISLLLGAYWVLYRPGTFSVGSLAFFAMMIQRLLWPVTRLGVIFDELERARASARRIFGLLDHPPRMREPERPRSIDRSRGHLLLENVTFAYGPQGPPVLKNIHLDIPAGEVIGIAGPTGGGKTTLIKLLLRFYDVQSGRILLDGVDIRTLPLQGLRRQFALVSQEVYLFHGTIRENIAYGMPEKALADIEEAARRAEMHDFIRQLPRGYDTVVGERGIKLSGGQRQRLSIARALLKEAPILILDEATSAVDTETERAIQQHLQELTRNKTALLVAHRLSTIRRADRILVIDRGTIAEQGKHEDLLKLNGIYADLWRIQLGETMATS